MSKRKLNWYDAMTPQGHDSQNGSGNEKFVPEELPVASLYDAPEVSVPKETFPEIMALSKMSEPFIRLKIGYFDKIDNRYLAYNLDDVSQAWLVDASLLKFSSAEQYLSLSILGEQIIPYDWTKEIEALIPDVNQVRLALWSSGLVAKKEGLNFREVVARTLSRGVVPIKGAK